MARLPQPGGDKGSWGDILNDFLSQAHDSGGNLRSGVVGNSQLADGAVTEVKLSSAVQTKLNDSGVIADNSISTVKLQDDSVTSDKIAPGAVTKTDVGLSNVDNTADADKPISTATQTALDAKYDTNTATTALATKQDKTTLATDVAAHVTDGSVLDTAIGDKIEIAKADPYTLQRLDRQNLNAARKGGGKALIEYTDKTNATIDWSTTTAGGAIPATNAQVSGNRLYALNGTNPGGANIPLAVAAGEYMHISFLLYWKAGGTSDACYFGIDADAVGATPSASAANAMLYGINTTHARGAFIGANMTTASQPQTIIGTTPTTDTTYVVDIEVDVDVVTISYRALDSTSVLFYSYISRSILTGLSKPINHLRLSVLDSRGLSGSSYSPVIISRSSQPGRTRTVASQLIDGADHYHRGLFVPNSSPVDGMHVALPKSYDPRRPSPVVMFFHQTITGNELTPWSDFRMWPVTDALNDAGYIVVGVKDNGDRYGNAASLANYMLAYSAVRDNYNTGQVFLLSASGGGLPSLNLLSHRAFPTPAAFATIGGACNLADIYSNPVAGPIHAPLIRGAYGIAADGSDYAAKTAGYDPMLREGWEFRGVPMRFYTSTGDDSCPKAVHCDAMAAKVQPYVPEANVVIGSGGHLDPSQYQGSDLVSFFNTYL